MKINGAQAIVKSLELEKVDTIFGYPGAAISPFYDALLEGNIKHILTRHEQGAAHAANAYARVTGKVGVCVATSGPGATNLITGIANAYMDSIPIIAITGQVDSSMIGTDAFQEADITGATTPFCKNNYLVKKAEDLPRIIKEAFHIASTGRPGPIVIDVPVDVQNSIIDFKYPETVDIRGYKPTIKGHPMQIKRAVAALEEARAPVICAGGGVITSKASAELVALAEKCDVPVATTLMGIGSIPSNHRLYTGMVGTHGSRLANYVVHHADLVVIVGARVGDRAMGAASSISKRAKIIHIDIDPAEIGKNIEASIPVVGDARLVLSEMIEEARELNHGEWFKEIEKQKELYGTEKPKGNCESYVNPKYLLSILSEYLPDDAVVTTEVGQNQIWAANNYCVRKPGTFITSGGLGTMGYGLPAGIGAKLGMPKVPVVVVSGDGSFQMSMQELGTIKQYGIGVKIILFNNYRLGMVRELQMKRHSGRYSQCFLDENPDFVAIAAAYGIRGERISSDRDVRAALERLCADDEPYLLECIVDPMETTL